MAAVTEVARLRRSVEELSKLVKLDLRSKSGMTPAQRQAMKSEVEWCIQELDELRTRLTAG